MLFQTQALQRKLVLTQDELKRSESKLATTSKDLEEASDRTNAIAKAIKILESKNMIDEGSKYTSSKRKKKSNSHDFFFLKKLSLMLNFPISRPKKIDFAK